MKYGRGRPRSALTGRRSGSPEGGGVSYGRAGLTAKRRQAVIPLAGYGKPRLNATCSKLPSHAPSDVRSPREVARDRNSAYTHAKVRQAHREQTSRAPGGVAGQPSAYFSHCEQTSRAPGGVARSPHASVFHQDSFRAWRCVARVVCGAPGGVAGQPSASFPRARLYQRRARTSRSPFQPSACTALGAGTLDSQEKR